MNLLGRIFVVLILVMSLVFLGFSVAVYATHKNWKAVVLRPREEAKQGQPPGLKFQLEDERNRANQLQDQLKKLKEATQTEDQALRQRLGQLETDKTVLQKERDQLLNEQAGLKEGERRAVEAAQVAQETLEARLEESRKLRSDLAKAYEDRDSRFKESVELTDKLHEAETKLARLESNTQMLVRQVALYRERAEKQGVDINAPADNIPPKLDGIVLAARSNGLVEISLGSDDGLRKGHQAYIFRQQKGEAKPVAKIEVVEVTPDKSVGKVIPEYRLGPIERNDRVATRLN
jgi:superfamily II RNA helicase